MVVRIHNVTKWSALQPGQVLELKGQDKRKVRVEFNCPAPTRVDLVDGDKVIFLAVITGHEAVEFSAGEEVHLVCTSETETWFFTNDGDQVAVSRPEAVSFTKIATRRARNPQLELMMFKMEQNINRRLEAQRVEFEAMMAANPPHDPETGEVLEDDGMESGSGGTGPEAPVDPGVVSNAGGSGEPEPASGAAKKAKGAKADG